MKISWSIISIISRFAAVGIGLIQSIVIVKILSVEEYGLIGLVGSIAAIVGVYQNLGISSASTREIAATDNRTEAFKVFLGSLFVRYCISIPLVLLLFAMAPYLGNVKYERPEIVQPVRIFAIVLLIQALQSVLNSVIQGLKEFKFLFTFQVGIALVSLFTYIYLIYQLSYIGYFYALLVFNLISTLVLLIYALKLFKGHVELPSRIELLNIIKAVFAIGIFVYVIKILLIQWQRLGPVVLANELDNASLGILAFALLVATKVSVISDAITDVSLPSMTNVYEKSKDQFSSIFLKNNSKAFLLILFASVMLILLKEPIFLIVDYVFAFVGKDRIYDKYQEAFLIMDPLIIGFWAYSHINLLKSSLAIPAKKMWGALFSYGILLGLTLLSYKFITLDPLIAYSLAMAIGAVGAYIFLIFETKRSIGFYPLTSNDLIYLLVGIFVLAGYLLGGNIYVMSLIFLLVTIPFYLRLDDEKND